MKKNSVIIYSDTSLLEALDFADKNDNSVFLVADNKDIIGYLTDNWIRELAIKTTNLNKKVKDFTLNNFYIEENKGEVLYSLEKKYNLIIQKKDDKVEKIFGPVVENLINDLKFIPVVIMAGGEGIRLRPYTEILPKPLLPINNKAIIEIIIESFRKYNIENFYLTLNYQSEFIKAFFSQKERQYKINFIEEEQPLGTIGAIKILENTIEKPFFVSNCDIIIKTNYAKLYNFHLKNNFDITLVGVLKKNYIPYGVCSVDEDMKLISLQEKPYNMIIINGGLYVINPDVIKFIPSNKKFDITDLINTVQSNGGRIGVFPISSESWIDLGTIEEFKKNISKLI